MPQRYFGLRLSLPVRITIYLGRQLAAYGLVMSLDCGSCLTLSFPGDDPRQVRKEFLYYA